MDFSAAFNIINQSLHLKIIQWPLSHHKLLVLQVSHCVLLRLLALSTLCMLVLSIVLPLGSAIFILQSLSDFIFVHSWKWVLCSDDLHSYTSFLIIFSELQYYHLKAS